MQSGSNRILKLMNRNYTVEDYLKQIGWMREHLPDVTVSTDIIVGFPGETETDFKETMDIIEKIIFNNIFSFIYSPRKFTIAALFVDSCSKEEKLKRLESLQKRSIEIVKEKNNNYVGEILKCLVEKRATSGKLLARSAGNLNVLFDGDNSIIDTFVNIKVESAGAANLIGSLI